jgi:hypothetical protein
VPSDPFPFLAGVPIQRTFMLLGGASAWAELLVAVGMWLPVAAIGLAFAAFLAVRHRSLVLPVAAFALALTAQLLAFARLMATPLYHSAVMPGAMPPWVLDSLTRALHTAFDGALVAGSLLVVGALLARAR